MWVSNSQLYKFIESDIPGATDFDKQLVLLFYLDFVKNNMHKVSVIVIPNHWSAMHKRVLCILQGYLPYCAAMYHVGGIRSYPRSFHSDPQIKIWRQKYEQPLHIFTNAAKILDGDDVDSESEEEDEDLSFEPQSGIESMPNLGETTVASTQQSSSTPDKDKDGGNDQEDKPPGPSSYSTFDTVGSVAGSKSGMSSRLLPSNFNPGSWGGWK